LAHGLGSACAAHASGAPTHVPHTVTVPAGGAMARPMAARWWAKGEAVGGVRRKGPRYTRPARRAVTGLTEVLVCRLGGGGEAARWHSVAVGRAPVDVEQRALSPELHLAEGNLQCLCAGSGSADGRCYTTLRRQGRRVGYADEGADGAAHGLCDGLVACCRHGWCSMKPNMAEEVRLL
jgi:hypothetical protein